MKKNALRYLAAALSLSLVTGLSACAASSESDTAYKIGVIQMIENGAFDDMRRGFIDRLTEEYGDDVAITYENAQGDPSTLNTIVQSMAGGEYDLVATIATPPTVAFVNQESDTPNVFIAVSNPVAAGVLSTFEQPDKNTTGTSNPIPVDRIVDLALELTPGIAHFGIIYNSSEINSVNTVAQAKEYMDSQGFTYREATVTASSEVQQTAEQLAAEVDAIFVPNDSVIQNAMPVLIEAATKAGVPVYGSSAVMVASGALATVAIGDIEIGASSAEMAIRILEGESPADVPAQAIAGEKIDLNQKTADALGVSFPAEISAEATIHN